MVFSSVGFLFYFLPVFLLGYYLSPWPNATILAASLLFYAWGDVAHLPVLLAFIALNYAAGLVAGAPGARGRWGVRIGVAGNLAMLVAFKYLAFLAAQIGAVAGLAGIALPPAAPLALPLGISFFTFQGISYLVDIGRGVVTPQRSLLKFAMYKAMFPPLIAGPIVRYAVIAGRVDHHPTTPTALARGLEAFAVGLGQKVLLANTLAGPVDAIFAQPPGALGALAAWTGAAGYGLQIYFDFCGYSNMAIGLGRMIGFELPVNFDRPYAARSLAEFWRRWHITLSSWFRDYVYIPLGGSRRGRGRTYVALGTVFLLCGLWHGASWNFVVWGAWHGAFLMIERAGLARVLTRLPAGLRHLYLVVVVTIGWVFFRAETLPAAWDFLRAMAGAGSGEVGLPASFLAAMAVGAVASVWASAPAWGTARQAACLGLLVLAAASLAAGTYNPFIYYRF